MKCKRCRRELKNHTESEMGKVCQMKANRETTADKVGVRVEPLFIRRSPRRSYLVFTKPRMQVVIAEDETGRYATCPCEIPAGNKSMSLIRKQTLIGLCCAAALLDVDESTIRKGLCGTENLTQVRRGNGKRQRISLILEEVVALKADQINTELEKKFSSSGGKSKLQLVV